MNGATWIVSALLVGALAGCSAESDSAAEPRPDSGDGSGGSGGSGGAGGGGASGGWPTDAAADGSAGAAGAAGSDAGSCVTTVTRQPLAFSTGWDDIDPNSFAPGSFYKDDGGQVHLEGVVSKLGGTPAQSDVIATLPEEYRPGERLIFPGFAKGYGRVDVTATGEVLWISGATSEQDYISLSTISFLPGPTSTDIWTQPALGTWLDYGGVYAPAAYRKDDSGTVHLRGLIKKSGATSGETIFTLPDGFRPPHRLIFLVSSGSATPGRIDIDVDGRVIWYPGNSGYVSLSGISFHLAATTFESAQLAGTWTDYSSTHAPAAYYKDCSGRVYIRGLVTESGGEPMSGPIFTLPEGYRPQHGLVFPVATRLDTSSGPVTGRVDIHIDGQVVWMSGGTFEKDWTNLTGISFAP